MGTQTADAGYVALDAIVATFIFASAIILALSLSHQALRITAATVEVREARALMQSLFQTYRTTTGVIKGTTGQFAWLFAIGRPHTSSAAQLCTHRIVIKNLTSGRTYSAVTKEFCRVEGAS